MFNIYITDTAKEQLNKLKNNKSFLKKYKAVKKTIELLPLCHLLPLTSVKVEVNVVDEGTVEVLATVKARAQTGVEMEALAAVSMGLLTVWDMTKQYEKDAAGQYPSTAIENIHVVRKFKQM